MKVSKAIVEARIVEVFRLLCDGAELHDLIEYVHEQASNSESVWFANGKRLSRSQIYRYSRAAWKRVYETTKVSRKRLLRRHIVTRRNLVAKSIAAGDLRTALSALDSEARLLRLDETPTAKSRSTKIPTNVGDIVNLLAERLKEIENSKLSASERVRLTTALSETLMKAISIDELTKRMAALEEKLQGDAGDGSPSRMAEPLGEAREEAAGAGIVSDGVAQGGPSELVPPCGNDARPVASPATAIDSSESVAPLFPPGGEEHDSGRDRTG